jgi:hypothetical protein
MPEGLALPGSSRSTSIGSLTETLPIKVSYGLFCIMQQAIDLALSTFAGNITPSDT